MKKMIALMLCFLLLMGCAVSVSAADTTKVEIIADKAEAKPGDEITFEVRIDGSETCKSIGIALQYDKTVFEIKEGKCGLENATLSIFDESVGFAYLFQDGVVPEGTVGTFTMTARQKSLRKSPQKNRMHLRILPRRYPPRRNPISNPGEYSPRSKPARRSLRSRRPM